MGLRRLKVGVYRLGWLRALKNSARNMIDWLSNLPIGIGKRRSMLVSQKTWPGPYCEFRPIVPSPPAGTTKWKLSSGAALQTPVFRQSCVSWKNVPGVEVRPSCTPSIPLLLREADLLIRRGRSFPPWPSPLTSNPSKTVSAVPLSTLATEDHCQRSVSAFRIASRLEYGNCQT